MPELDEASRRSLLTHAEATILSGLRRRPIPDGELPDRPPPLDDLGASFVTLERGEELLGCIGTIEAVRPLYEDVMQNAYRAAFADPRLPAVTPADYEVMTLKVSVLRPLAPLACRSYDELVAALRPGIDGLVIAEGGRRATFLPSVWQKVAEPDEFVDLLVRKAGLDGRRWRSSTQAWRYTTDEIAGKGPRSAAGVAG